jgi:hypothetical protein
MKLLFALLIVFAIGMEHPIVMKLLVSVIASSHLLEMIAVNAKRDILGIHRQETARKEISALSLVGKLTAMGMVSVINMEKMPFALVTLALSMMG